VPAAQAAECEGLGVEIVGVADARAALEAGLAPRRRAASDVAEPTGERNA
jgi:hypothetical protein